MTKSKKTFLFLKDTLKNNKKKVVISILITFFILTVVSASTYYIYRHPVDSRSLKFDAQGNNVSFSVSSKVLFPLKIELKDDKGSVIYSRHSKFGFNKNLKWENIGHGLNTGKYYAIFSSLGFRKEFPFTIDREPPTLKLTFKDDGRVDPVTLVTRSDEIALDYEIEDNTELEYCHVEVSAPSFSGGAVIPITNLKEKKGSITVYLEEEGGYFFVLKCRDVYKNENKERLLGLDKSTGEQQLPVVTYDVTKSKKAPLSTFNDPKYPYSFKYPSNWTIENSRGEDEVLPWERDEGIRRYSYHSIITTDFNVTIYIDVFLVNKNIADSYHICFYPYNKDEFLILNSIDGLEIGRSKTYYSEVVEDPNAPMKKECPYEVFFPGRVSTKFDPKKALFFGKILYPDVIPILAFGPDGATQRLPLFGATDGKYEEYSQITYGFDYPYDPNRELPQGFEEAVKMCDRVIKSLKSNPNWVRPI